MFICCSSVYFVIYLFIFVVKSGGSLENGVQVAGRQTDPEHGCYCIGVRRSHPVDNFSTTIPTFLHCPPPTFPSQLPRDSESGRFHPLLPRLYPLILSGKISSTNFFFFFHIFSCFHFIFPLFHLSSGKTAEFISIINYIILIISQQIIITK